jgi:hypothetical protein
MQRNVLPIMVSCMLGGLGCLSENPNGRPSTTDYWSTLGDGETGDDAGGTETGMGDGTNSSDGEDAGDGDPGDDDSGDGDSGDGDSGDGDPGDGDSGDGDPGDGDSGDGDPGDSDPGDGDPDAEEDPEPCASVSEEVDFAEVPADIIVIVDNSIGMEEEAAFVQAQMNDLSAQIENSGIDLHIVLISSYPDQENGICVDPPLGSGNCPNNDSNLPVYRHVDEKVGSHNPLAKLIATHQEWQGSVRPDSVKHIVVVSDDESGLSSELFKNQFFALDPNYDPFVFHALVCSWDCPEASHVGEIYIDLVNQTGGVLGDLCAQNFLTVFDELANAVIQGVPLSCQFDIPPPPMGMELDPDLVDVEIDDGNGNLENISRVDDLADCMNHPDGWYYDDPQNPAQVRLCPQTCAQAQGYAMGTVDLEFGCLAGN